MAKIIGNLVGTTIPLTKVDGVFDPNSSNAVANKVLAEIKAQIEAAINEIDSSIVGTNMRINDIDKRIVVLISDVEELDERFSGLDSIVEQNEIACLEGLADHEDRITELEPVVLDYGDTENLYVEPENNTVYYYGIVSEGLGLYPLPEIGLTSVVHFATPSSIPSDYHHGPADIYYKGDSTDNGAFVPEANMRYTIVYDFDGYMLNGYVSGVSMV